LKQKREKHGKIRIKTLNLIERETENGEEHKNSKP
jgi:hypothetical protein